MTNGTRIRNPLVGVPKSELLADVEQFASDNNLMDILPLLKKGALLAQNPRDLDKIDGLEDSERADILMEVSHRWRHPKMLYFTIILNSIAAAIQGWDQTGKLESQNYSESVGNRSHMNRLGFLSIHKIVE
jgi:hypothetical protein